MTRVLSVVVFALLVAGLFLLPPANPGRLASLQTYQLCEEPVGPAPAPGPDGEPVEDTRANLAQVVLASAAVTRPAPGRATLTLDGVRLIAPRERLDLEMHGLARRSLLRGLRQVAAEQGLSLKVEGELMPARVPRSASFLLTYVDGRLELEFSPPDEEAVTVGIDWDPPGRSSLYPPLVAILLAILFRRPVLALFAGVWTGAVLVQLGAGTGAVASLPLGLKTVASDLFWPELTDPYRMQIVGFVLAMLAMVGVMTRSGGLRGLMDLVSRLAGSARSTMVSTWVMGISVFFDDYANCILVGSTMRPLSDRYRIAREKLAYLVDSTAAPVAGISIFSTWIAFEVSTFSAQLPAADLLTTDGYAVFLETLPFRFYCLLSLFLALVIALSGRDFGPMLGAERRARSTGQLVRPGGAPMVGEQATSLEPAAGVTPRAHRAILPVLCFVFVTLFEIGRVGLAAVRENQPEFGWADTFTLKGITDLLGDGDSTRAILVGSTTGMLLAMGLAFGAGLRSEILRAAWTTVRAMGIAVVILYLAWMIGRVCDLLGTAPYLSELLSDQLAPEVLPALLFLLGALVAFSTGSSWSTMSILLPLVVGLAFTLGQDSPLGGHLLMVISIGAVLEGSIFGDHCSPISDTTVLSSTAAASDHIDHVRTQAPYAITTMLVALVLGYLPCTFLELSPWLGLLLGMAALLMIVFVFGRKSETVAVPGRPAS